MVCFWLALAPVLVYGMAIRDHRRAQRRGEDPTVVHFAARLYAYKEILGPAVGLIAVLLFGMMA